MRTTSSPATLLLLGLALAVVALQLGAARWGPYGLFHDELYYWANAKRPGLGYVDHPPLAPWVLAATITFLGEGRLTFALLAALCGAGAIVMAGLMAHRLGANPWGQFVAALSTAAAPFVLAFSSFYSVNALELLCWTAACFVLVELIRTGDERLWLVVGLIAGLGLLNKHTFTLLAFGFAVGIVATPLRAHLRRPWPWLGGALAVLIAFPNLYWNLAHGWPSLAFYRTRPAMNLPTSPVEAMAFQIAGANPMALLVWAPGVIYLLCARAVRPYRPLGIAFLTLFALMLFSGQRRGDRIAGIYPIAFAAGAAFWDQWRFRWQGIVRWGLPALLLIGGALAVPAVLPVLPPAAAARYFEAVGQSPEIEAVDAGQKIPLHLNGRLEWERFAADVIAGVETLPLEEQARAVVLTPHWAYASVIEYYGRERRIPPVVSPHNAYYFWRHEAAGRDIAVSIGIDPEVLSDHFAETRQVGMFQCVHCATGRHSQPIYVSYRPVRPIEQLLVDWRYFGIEPAPALRTRW